MSVAIALFTRDLRLSDNPTFAAATHADHVVPLFVLDERILSGSFNRPNRAHFLAESLADLDGSLQSRGAALVVRRGRVEDEVAAVARETGADTVHVSGDVSGYAQARRRRMTDRLAGDGVRLVVHDGTLFVVPPGVVTPQDRDHMAVFTPYFRRWSQQSLRDRATLPESLVLPPSVGVGRVPLGREICAGATSPDRLRGGETEGRRRLEAWVREGLAAYDERHDALGEEGTSRLSAYLHFGCISPLELVRLAGAQPGVGAQEFVRQVAWRDFYAQLLAARPDAVRADFRPRGDRWHHDPQEVAAWKEGRTGYPVVDAAMRQLMQEGWMHNRARLIVGHFLCKTLYVDWRVGAAHFADLLIDGDTASNTMNWQWVAGTGTDSRFNRTYNIVLQARRHDPDGRYVRRYVPELAEVDAAYIHEPWLLPQDQRERLGYPEPVVEQAQARDRLRRGRAGTG
ncbi:MAG: deoxyribodipyrimidine photo-lyase [Actinomycetota bacterium]|nr:deoxyribodipyrimidine photo-lyase [Actinomycetota bacterium]